ncbi:MAG: AmmeMemoRadiSam system protein A [Armatimonadetes bacterium]|nr:AmmeMemoRadiSam system protein A [Armatimonadota bacterium]
MLSYEQKRRLLEVARQSLHAAVAGGPPPDLATDDPDLLELRGAFVTLKTGGQLRGCIGYVEPRVTLIEAVADNARSAALHDPRFTPVAPEELPEIELDISALTPLEPVHDVEQVEVGRHGLMISCGPARGLLLPQVPVEWGWDREEFLEHTCLKAGLPPDAWRREDAELLCFEAEVFSEAELGS